MCPSLQRNSTAALKDKKPIQQLTTIMQVSQHAHLKEYARVGREGRVKCMKERGEGGSLSCYTTLHHVQSLILPQHFLHMHTHTHARTHTHTHIYAHITHAYAATLSLDVLSKAVLSHFLDQLVDADALVQGAA